MDIYLANASQASIIVSFVPNADESHFMQHFFPKMCIKELIKNEQLEEQKRLQEAELRNEEAELARKEENQRSTFTRKNITQ